MLSLLSEKVYIQKRKKRENINTNTNSDEQKDNHHHHHNTTQHTQQQQQALLRVGASIIEKKQIRIAEKFRYTFLTDLVERDVVLFSQVSVYVKNDV